MSRYKPTGWRGESHRHYLARKGIKTRLVAYAHGVPIKIHRVPSGSAYPIHWDEVKKRVEQMPKRDVEGMKAIEFDNPHGEQKHAWAQYVRSRKTLKIFSQPVKGKTIDGQPLFVVNQHMKDYVIPHEVGHHKALSQENITDKDIRVAEARADANVVGLSPRDKEIKHLVRT